MDMNTTEAAFPADRMARQIELETRMQSLGIEAFWKQINHAKEYRQEAQTSYGHVLLQHNIGRIAAAILAFIGRAKSGKPGPKHHAVKYLEQVDPRVAAMLTLRTVVDGTSNRMILQRLAIDVATRIEDEVRYHFFEGEDKPLFRKVKRQTEKSSSYRHRRTVVVYAFNKKGVEWDSWPVSDKLHLGTKLIELVMEETKLFETQTIAVKKNRTNIYVVATEELTKWITQVNARNEMLTALTLPCVVPPKPWTEPIGGGYWTTAVPELKLVKSRNKAYLEELSNRVDEMPIVYEAVNALQDTAWTINQDVLAVMKHLSHIGNPVAGIPAMHDVEYVVCPICGAPVLLGRPGVKTEPHPCFDVEGNEELHKKWKKDAAKAHLQNNSLRSKRLAFNRTLWVAEMFEPNEAITMPYTLDFRGRIYAVPFLNPQGDDQMKGLLTFHQGLPILDGVAAGWLAIQGANTFGYDKASLEDRISWVEDRNDLILTTASDPLADLWWTEADSPWQFLAFVFEWAGFLREGYGYVSRLPVALDGSCSGIQHFSAMLRDSRGGKEVNLLPSDKPSDIYAEVCRVATAQLCLDASTRGCMYPEKGDETPEEAVPLDILAQAILDLEPNRSATKRQVMTLPYGATIYSCREYTEQWLKEQIEEGKKPFPFEPGTKPWFYATQYFAQTIWDAIGEVVIAARDAMGWLQAAAKVVAAEGLPIVWTTPVGLPIQQAYPEMASRRVKTKLGDSQVYLTLREETAEIDKARMKSSVSPNFVHSMDAAHLMWSVSYALANGITSFAMIHDSFGTHAANADLLGRCLRQAFVDMYTEHDVLAEFKASIEALLPPERRAEIPPLPPRGDLDLNVVLSSDFFFA